MKVERFANGPLQASVQQITGDMGEAATLKILVTRDGDVIITMRDPNPISEGQYRAGVGQEISMQFCTINGGSKNPQIAQKIRELVFLLTEEMIDILPT